MNPRWSKGDLLSVDRGSSDLKRSQNAKTNILGELLKEIIPIHGRTIQVSEIV